jgi:hypothetical protein
LLKQARNYGIPWNILGLSHAESIIRTALLCNYWAGFMQGDKLAFTNSFFKLRIDASPLSKPMPQRRLWQRLDGTMRNCGC